MGTVVPSQVKGWRKLRAIAGTPSIRGQVPHPFNPVVLGLDCTSEPPESFRS